MAADIIAEEYGLKLRSSAAVKSSFPAGWTMLVISVAVGLTATALCGYRFGSELAWLHKPLN